ncbi:TRAP transporter small permease [Pseudooceanicola sp.]|uniref:TRAP transporter small permease n=1 Tax=Pseudooceanicola sp. TaxID=1914328 RepID=UPI0035180B5C
MQHMAERLLGRFDSLFLLICKLAMVGMMLATSIDAIGRYLFNAPLQGGYEMTSLYFMVVLCFLGIAPTYAAGGHIRLDILRGPLSRLPYRLSERINIVLAGAVFAAITWYSGAEALHKIEARTTSFGAIAFPLYLSFVWVPLGSGAMTLRLMVEFIWPQSHTATEDPL